MASGSVGQARVLLEEDERLGDSSINVVAVREKEQLYVYHNSNLNERERKTAKATTIKTETGELNDGEV